MTSSPAPPAPVTLRVNHAGWRRLTAIAAGGTYSDERVGAVLGLAGTTVYRVRTGRLAPGPKVVASALSVLGVEHFDDLFDIVEDDR